MRKEYSTVQLRKKSSSDKLLVFFKYLKNILTGAAKIHHNPIATPKTNKKVHLWNNTIKPFKIGLKIRETMEVKDHSHV